jgi:chemotaxis protein CheX
MDVKYINPFLNGTLEVLKTMAFLDPVAGKPYLKQSDTAAGDVSAIIGITGDAIGSLAISFSESCICGIVSNMLGEIFTDVNKDVFDAAGEITNMVSGVARSYLEKQGMAVYAAIPTVVYGRGHTVMHILRAPSIVIPFSTIKGNFVIDVCIKTVEAAAKKDQEYRVVNVRTADLGAPITSSQSTAAAPPAAQAARTETEAAAPAEKKSISIQEAATDEEKIAILKERLASFVAKRDDVQKQLRDKPFMPLDTRNKLKKELPQYDERIRKLKLDIAAIEMMAKMSQDQLDSPKSPVHYQHYQKKDK